MKLMTTIVMLGLAVTNVVASPVIRGTSDVKTSNAETSNAETSNAETEILELLELYPSSKGEAPPPEQAGPEPGDGAVAPESPESVALAEKFSDDEFISFATTKGMIKSVTETLTLSIKDIRTKVLGYKPLDPKSPSFKVRPGKVAAGSANAALGVVTVGVWVKGMVDAFEHDVNLLDKTAAVTSIAPFVGCTTNLAAQTWKGELSEDHINFLSIFHTLEVTKLLHGYIKEDQLRNPWKSEIKDARPLRLLIAMKFGKIVEERKGSGASGPDIPPLLGWDSAPLLAAITGLSEEISRSLPMGEEYLPYKDEGLISEKMIMAMLRLAQSWSAPNGNKGQTTDKAEI
ncbi:hypothetical protein MY3957_010040 [Beauveria namnaoensis]